MAADQDIALVVLQHGLWGVKSHMGYIEKKLDEKYGKSIYILNSSVNEAKYSYDGVDICGSRLAEHVQSTIVRLGKTGKKVTKISLIGYSLGGLIVRYAIGVLGEKGLFNTIEPDYFITFATPHMGVKKPSASIPSKIFNFISGRLVSRSGEQLQLVDKYDKENNKTMLEVLSDTDQIYYKNLAKFRVRRTYVNLANDRTVPYWTAGIEVKDYFHNSKGKIDLTMDDTYTSILTAFDVRPPGAVKKSSNRKDKRSAKSQAMLYCFYCLFPFFFPFFFIIALSTISIQGLMSRYRVSRLLSGKQLLITNDTDSTFNHEPASEADRFMDGELLAGALDAVNFPGEESPPLIKRSSSQKNYTSDDTIQGSEVERKNGDNAYYFKVTPTKAIEEKAVVLPFDETTLRIYKNLSTLDWEKGWVYIRVLNAHGGIICRQTIHTSAAGEAAIKNFIDTTHFS